MILNVFLLAVRDQKVKEEERWKVIIEQNCNLGLERGLSESQTCIKNTNTSVISDSLLWPKNELGNECGNNAPASLLVPKTYLCDSDFLLFEVLLS